MYGSCIKKMNFDRNDFTLTIEKNLESKEELYLESLELL